jgi:hypothetical protein
MRALIRFLFDVMTKGTREKKQEENDDDRKHLCHPVRRQNLERYCRKK